MSQNLEVTNIEKNAKKHAFKITFFQQQCSLACLS